jgi:hypothetical protein
MGKSHAFAVAVLGLLLVAGWFFVRRGLDPERRPVAVETGEPGAGSGTVGGPAAPTAERTPPDEAVIRDDVVFTPTDVAVFDSTVAWARSAGVDTLGIGSTIVELGRRFVGHPYTPHTLDPPGDERLIVNLREFDCVTYVESMLAMARVLRDARGGDAPTFAAFTNQLRRIRYRGGTMDGYPSRLHYFSEWIADNGRMGLVRDVTSDLGGTPDAEAIDFMSTHSDAYAQLDGQPDRIERIRAIEAELSGRTRTFIPQDRIGQAADGIRDGDIIAATSSVEGLDIAHTGFALWLDGDLHLMHAPLVGRQLEISEQPLAVRILRIDGQDGIMVARPL